MTEVPGDPVTADLDLPVPRDTDAVNGLRQLLRFRADLAHDLRWHPGNN